ncbi:EVE domain-containing protein [Stutzerimonas azotifigens]|uniref:EVE domain-containing protein n=1 Tax=Stutzerimonas azotifigens TaxID=291995 RepID=UPI000421C0C0|nr:EVE domain-containing protein [Stutzerimonas azotifigens]
MPYWLMKSEPDEFSVTDLEKRETGRWDGVRNYQARNHLRAMQPDDLFLFYHSSCPIPGVAGIGRIVRGAYPDPTATDPQSPYFDPKTAGSGRNPWSAVDVAHVETFAQVLPLTALKAEPALAELALVQRGSRLSVMPVGEREWAQILRMARSSQAI